MIVIVDSRIEVGQAFVNCFEREGVASTALECNEFPDWFSGLCETDLLAIEAILLGAADDRPKLLRLIQQRGRMPVIALSDRRTLDETLSLLAAGVDDVVSKPVHVKEILARSGTIRARRGDVTSVSEIVGIRLYADGRDPEIAGEALQLPRRERRILECLARNRGGWVTKSQIFNQVYGLLNDEIDENVIESHISRLRKRLRQRLGRDPVESQRFMGYRLSVGPHEPSVTVTGRSPAPPSAS